MTKSPVESEKDLDKTTAGGVAHTRYPLAIHFNSIQNAEKSNKINLRIISKPHAHLQTMTKTPVKFQKDWHKTAGGVAHTRYPIYIYFDSIRASK